ncbi:BRO family protein [Pasteurella multocida]|uniref:BRO-N domain-containing protein n=1 Tax=Pasteurella multocida TaxID=747 RepID=UPI000F6D205F|nr:BRO family protein [Pasteurella multocida]MDY0488550.1 BRO family protein [Pasteurella multocida]MDY0595057.1 BRO family protein [Pasteurella multocida]MDY0664458.1 BRO family protein [Pasteurella multocida]MDY0667405.1 BRO family protein [Pasteurella multocida]VEI57651.1 putative anti-repressor protein [Pasteurella multocida]
MTTLTFQGTTLSVINQNNQIYLSAAELAKALGYKQADSVTRIYNRNSDEFSENMTVLVKNPQAVNLTVRIFSLRGCHLIAMFARTPIAKEFRKWVLDILDRETSQPQQLALPEPDLNLTAIQNSEETLALIIQLYSYCFQAHEMQEKLQNTNIAKLMESQIGGQYLYNFKHPLEQVMAKAKKYVHANTERLALVKAVNNLLN